MSGPDSPGAWVPPDRDTGVDRWGSQVDSVLGRREALAILGIGLVGKLAGCSRPSFPDGDVVAGPDARNVFEPAELTVSVGETVTWGFGSAGHNVCCRPGDHDAVELPDTAEAFSSYGPEDSPNGTVVPRGQTYGHTFEVAGSYQYVCIPHVEVGMQGTVHVR